MSEGLKQSSELRHTCCGAGHGLCDGIQLDAEEGEGLRWALCLVRVDHQAEAGDDRLSGDELLRDLLTGCADEEEVVEVADVADTCPGEGEGDHREELSAHARGDAEAERHVGELIEATVEAEAEVAAD